ncbi:hypothetical protein Cni_G13991 [Canna indica]|uniref:Complex 1 LYR protein n=1 Tax=Canna indica TaxID=4628 RepID=A0AAQ3QBZ2_9LILI|nr:hypothetical protein Cni_G13991 [Canna indica]
MNFFKHLFNASFKLREVEMRVGAGQVKQRGYEDFDVGFKSDSRTTQESGCGFVEPGGECTAPRSRTQPERRREPHTLVRRISLSRGFFLIVFLFNFKPSNTLDMGSETMQATKVYRDLLKAIKKHIGDDGSKRHFRDYVTGEFRKNISVSDRATAESNIKLAREYTFLLNSVQHHKELLFSYNIAVDRSDEMKKILNKSAASVGLRLPDVYQS